VAMHQNWLQGEAVGDGEKITRRQQMSTITVRIPQAMKHKLLEKKLESQLYHPKKGQGLLFKHAAVIFPKKLVSKFKVTMLQDVLYSVREIKFLQEIQPGIRIFQKLTLMKSTKKPTEGKIFCCTILVIMTTIESSCLARQEILHC
jgi:hypothetical protein